MNPSANITKRPFRGMRGDFVVEQQDPHTRIWHVVDGANTKDRARAKGRLYPGQTRISPNHPGAERQPDSYVVQEGRSR